MAFMMRFRLLPLAVGATLGLLLHVPAAAQTSTVPTRFAMRELLLRFFFEGHATAAELARDVEGSVEREQVSGGPLVSRHHIEDMAVDFIVEPQHVVALIDAVAEGDLSVAALDAIAFCLEASDHFEWNGDTPEGERVAESLFWLGSPEINYPLTPEVLQKIRHYLLTGENLLTREDSRLKRAPAAEQGAAGDVRPTIAPE